MLFRERPHWVLVYGDTNSTLAGALAAVKLHIPVGHVEAGLRSFNRRMPEELNRVLTDHAADLLFAPTRAAVKNLRGEGIPDGKVRLVGDVMYDAALYYGAKAERESRVLERLKLRTKGYILVTVHRAENTDDRARLRAIFEGLNLIAQEVPVVFPLHPRTRKALGGLDILAGVGPKLQLIEPVGYLDMMMLEKNARLIATESGGVQKEAYFCRVPCVTLRAETEWVELAELGWNLLVPPNSSEAVYRGIQSGLLSSPRCCEEDLYGGGVASGKIVEALGDATREA